MKHKIIGDPFTLPDGTVLPLSRAVRAGDFVFLSGQLGIDENFKLASGIINQTQLCVGNIDTILKSISLSLENIVKTTVWLTDIENFAAFNLCYAELFSELPPARSTVCSALAIPGALIEIEVVAFDPR